ncbi:MAG TPA: UvrD-helicase domain-containing protein [Limnochordia bacterium]|nr:UvrD-helicase domain-containing protein [Limnochordia bacterium]
MQENDFQLEQDWLDFVYENIDEQLAQQKEHTRSYRDNLQEIRTSLWEEHGISGASANQLMDVAQQITELRHSATSFGIQHRLLQQLQTAEKAPYFGRIDFHEVGLPRRETLYLGIRSLIDQRTNLPLVYDWRAPVSSMFYDYGLGEAQYEGPGGVYNGEVFLKRQYRIKDRKLVYMFDNELAIDDEVLQEALGKHANEKMRTIVNTIQREQNQAIRNEHDDLLLVEGPAGSGKTSVALHRVAYLLYRYRDSIRSQNIVIFSPNRIFSNYISHVLPELGEENVFQTTFQDFVEPFLGWSWDLETQSAYLENLLKKQGVVREGLVEAMAFKASPRFQTVLNNLVNLIIMEAGDFFDVRVGKELIISAVEQKKLFTENYSYLPVQKRLTKIQQRITFLLKPIKKRRIKEALRNSGKSFDLEGESWWTVARASVSKVKEELAPILLRLDSQLKIDTTNWYRRLWQDPALWIKLSGGLPMPELATESLGSLEISLLSFEDVVPLCYLKGELEGYPIKREIQHVVVDEVQDYAPMQLQILTKTFPRARFTFVGDVFQSLNPYMWQAEKTLEGLYGDLGLKTVRLSKSYRSTEEIFHFCNALLEDQVQAVTVLRQGKKPSVNRVGSGERIRKIHDLIVAHTEEGFETIAIICETVQECGAIFAGLKEYDPKQEISLLIDEKATFKPGVVIVPVFLAKGLEFDSVIVPEASAQKYGEEYQRRLLYVACSRALHRLNLLYTDTEELSPFVAEMANELHILE